MEQIHFNYEQTIDRVKHVIRNFHCRDLRGTFKRMLARCKFCKKSKVKPRTGNFTVIVYNTTIEIPVLSPCFTTVTMHILISPTGARSLFGRHGIRSIYLLIIIEMLTGCFQFEYIDRITSDCFKFAFVNFTTEMARVPPEGHL